MAVARSFHNGLGHYGDFDAKDSAQHHKKNAKVLVAINDFDHWFLCWQLTFNVTHCRMVSGGCCVATGAGFSGDWSGCFSFSNTNQTKYLLQSSLPTWCAAATDKAYEDDSSDGIPSSPVPEVVHGRPRFTIAGCLHRFAAIAIGRFIEMGAVLCLLVSGFKLVGDWLCVDDDFDLSFGTNGLLPVWLSNGFFARIFASQCEKWMHSKGGSSAADGRCRHMDDEVDLLLRSVFAVSGLLLAASGFFGISSKPMCALEQGRVPCRLHSRPKYHWC